MSAKTEKAAQKKAELARRRAARAELEGKISALRQKRAAAGSRAAALKIDADIAALQAQIAAMPLRTR
jgi:hypothetical protein